VPFARRRFNRAAPPDAELSARPAWWRERGARVLRLWAVGILASLLVTGASAYEYLEGLQVRSLDLLLRMRELVAFIRDNPRLAPQVVVIEIDEQAWTESLKRRQPISRRYLARVLRGLQRAGVIAVGLDIKLDSPTTPEEDAELVEVIRGFSDVTGVSRVVLIYSETPKSGPLADPKLYEKVLRGAGEVPLDGDGVIRRVEPLVAPLGFPPTQLEPALTVALAARLAGLDPAELKRRLPATGGRVNLAKFEGKAGWIRIQEDIAPGQIWRINYVGPVQSLFRMPSDVLAAIGEPSAEAPADDNPLRGRVAFVGGTFRDSRDDAFATPHGSMPGVAIHATIAQMILTRSFIQPSGWLTSLAIQVGIALAAAVVMVLARPITATVLCLVGSVIIGIPASYLAFQGSGYWVDFLLPVLVTLMLGVGAEVLRRRRIRQSFDRYLSKEVAKQVIDESLRSERREVSILFSDLRGFTTLSETMPVEVVAARLTEYLEEMTAVFERGGMVNDFVGDAIIAFFGAPSPDPEHAWHAVQAADGMRRALDQLNERWAAAGLPTLRMGIGIHSGQVFAGNVGKRKMKYTVVGDSVNLASRVEGLNKELGTTILITDETRSTIGGRAETKDHGLHTVKGRSQPVHVHELLALSESIDTGGTR
jgi:adenylate cyclase